MSKRILIIDDEENIRRVTRLTLQAAGYQVGEASDGESGLEFFGDGSTWDAVLLDQRMPGMDGLETLRHISERDSAARVIMATAYASIELAVDAMKLGATDFVRKPMTPEILRNAVASALSKEARVREKARCPANRRRFSRTAHSNYHYERFHDLRFGKCQTRAQRAPLHSEEPCWRRTRGAGVNR
jgi:DNA-binding NtrC family response regulator